MAEYPASFLRPADALRQIGLRAEQRFVHLGCGAGFWLIPAAHIVGTGGKAIGVDIRSDMLSEAESRAEADHVGQIVETQRGDLEHERGSRLPDHMADVVLVANIVHQADPHKLLLEARRVAKPGGTVAIVEWDIAASPIGPPPEQRIPEPDIRQLAESLGLNFVRAFDPSPYHYGLIFTA